MAAPSPKKRSDELVNEEYRNYKGFADVLSQIEQAVSGRQHQPEPQGFWTKLAVLGEDTEASTGVGDELVNERHRKYKGFADVLSQIEQLQREERSARIHRPEIADLFPRETASAEQE